ncbi:MAG: carbonic anhydrase [Bacteroidales bacterium]
MEFGTSIHCMDGRIQEPLLRYIKDNYSIRYVDAITEPGPCKILSQNQDKSLLKSIDARLSISLGNHGSKMIFISAHHDCAGNPVSKETQLNQLHESELLVNSKYPNGKTVQLWVNENFEVEEIS